MKFCRIRVCATRVGAIAFLVLIGLGTALLLLAPWTLLLRVALVLGLWIGGWWSWRYRKRRVNEIIWRESRQWRLQFSDGSTVDGEVTPPLFLTAWLVAAALRPAGQSLIRFMVARWQTSGDEWCLLLGLLRRGR